MPKPESERRYIDVNIPRDWEPYLNEALELPEVQKGLEIAGRDNKPSSLGVWIIEQWLVEKTSFRFEYFNTYENHITIKDKKLPHRLIDIYIVRVGEREFKLRCEQCGHNCEHVKYALTIPEKTIKPIEGRGLKYKSTEDLAGGSAER